MDYLLMVIVTMHSHPYLFLAKKCIRFIATINVKRYFRLANLNIIVYIVIK